MIGNQKKSLCYLLQYAGELRNKGFSSTLSTRYLVEEVLHFLPEGHKRMVWIMIGRLRTPERLQSSLKSQTSTQRLQSPESNLKFPARKKVSTSAANDNADEY